MAVIITERRPGNASALACNDAAGNELVAAIAAQHEGRWRSAADRFRAASQRLEEAARYVESDSARQVLLGRAIEMELEAVRCDVVVLGGTHAAFGSH